MSTYHRPTRFCFQWKPITFLIIIVFFLIVALKFLSNFSNNFDKTSMDEPRKIIIYIVTPTYARSTQMADMTRLSQTLRLVPDIHWIVVEDSYNRSSRIADLLDRSGVNYTHLAEPSPKDRKVNNKFGKGTTSRRAALNWVRNNAKDGVLYFADDDNTYDIRVFEEMRFTTKVSVWPVGLINKYGVSSPIVYNGKVIGFHDPWISNRVFPMDMAGFAVSIELLKQNPNATMDYRTSYLEDSFLKSLNVTITDLEPKAKNCTEILTWHTNTLGNPYPNYIYLETVKEYNKTNLAQLYQNALDGKPT